MKVKVKGWKDFQHYKDRAPTWIKLHKSLLDNYDFQMLQLASRALAPMFWLLASESDDGSFDADPTKLAFRLRTTEKIVSGAINELIEKGFLELASDPLAEFKRVDSLEKRREEDIKKEEETTLSGKPDADSLKSKNREAKESARRVLEFLNTKTGKAYQPVEVNLDMIASRIKEGASEAQCRQVIARKAREWLTDEKMAEYLRPATLFNRTKFAQYMGELVVTQ